MIQAPAGLVSSSTGMAGRSRSKAGAGLSSPSMVTAIGTKPKSSSPPRASSSARSSPIRPLSSESMPAERASSTEPPSRAAATWSASTSKARSRVLATSSVSSIFPERSSSITVSKTWAKRIRFSRPKAPAPPFTE